MDKYQFNTNTRKKKGKCDGLMNFSEKKKKKEAKREKSGVVGKWLVFRLCCGLLFVLMVMVFFYICPYVKVLFCPLSLFEVSRFITLL